MKIIKVADIYIKPIDEEGDFEEDDGHDLYEVMDQADEIFNKVQVRPSSDSRYSYIAIANDKVVGAILSDWSINNDDKIASFSWDIAVHPDYQRKGVAKKLIENIIEKYESEKYSYEDMGYLARIYVTVINLELASYLERLGFEVDMESSDRKYMYKY